MWVRPRQRGEQLRQRAVVRRPAVLASVDVIQRRRWTRDRRRPGRAAGAGRPRPGGVACRRPGASPPPGADATSGRRRPVVPPARAGCARISSSQTGTACWLSRSASRSSCRAAAGDWWSWRKSTPRGVRRTHSMIVLPFVSVRTISSNPSRRARAAASPAGPWRPGNNPSSLPLLCSRRSSPWASACCSASIRICVLRSIAARAPPRPPLRRTHYRVKRSGYRATTKQWIVDSG